LPGPTTVLRQPLGRSLPEGNPIWPARSCRRGCPSRGCGSRTLTHPVLRCRSRRRSAGRPRPIWTQPKTPPSPVRGMTRRAWIPDRILEPDADRGDVDRSLRRQIPVAVTGRQSPKPVVDIRSTALRCQRSGSSATGCPLPRSAWWPDTPATTPGSPLAWTLGANGASGCRTLTDPREPQH
jgi:hypothetical protein